MNYVCHQDGSLRNITLYFSAMHLSNILYAFLSIMILLHEEALCQWVLDKYKDYINPISDTLIEDVRVRFVTFITIFIVGGWLIREYREAVRLHFNSCILLLFSLAFISLAPFDYTCRCLQWELVSFLSFFLIVSIRNSLGKRKENIREVQANKGFLNDQPLQVGHADDIDTNINQYAGIVIDRLWNTDLSNTAFCLGITGSWGCGKSTFLNVLKHQLDMKHKDQYISMDFNAWGYPSKEALQSAFIDELRNHLSPYNLDIANDLNDYMQVVEENSDGALKMFLSLFKRRKGLMATKEAINDAIEAIQKPLFVWIDDVDRLDKGEILAVLKLIRNTANFKSLVFVMAYDKHYVCQTLGEMAHGYLQKVVNVELSLPMIDKSKYVDRFATKLKELTGINPTPIRVEQEVEKTLAKHLTTFRKVIVLTNEIAVNLQGYVVNNAVQGIYLRDFILLELLRFENNKLYSKLRDKTFDFLDYKPEADFSFVIKEDANIYGTETDIIDLLFRETSWHIEELLGFIMQITFTNISNSILRNILSLR